MAPKCATFCKRLWLRHSPRVLWPKCYNTSLRVAAEVRRRNSRFRIHNREGSQIRLLTSAATKNGRLRLAGGSFQWDCVGSYLPGMPREPKGNLPRLARHHYQGHAVVFWTNTLEERARGWLTPPFHATISRQLSRSTPALRRPLFRLVSILLPNARPSAPGLDGHAPGVRSTQGHEVLANGVGAFPWKAARMATPASRPCSPSHHH